ncbi:hypothetical protein UlMin_035051 [Ulmus minor]
MDSQVSRQDDGNNGKKNKNGGQNGGNNNNRGGLPPAQIPRFRKYTPLTETVVTVFNQAKHRGIFNYPPGIRTPANKRDNTKYCRFHRDTGHTTEECRVLKDEVERLIQRGQLREYVRVKFPTVGGIGILRGDQTESREIYEAANRSVQVQGIKSSAKSRDETPTTSIPNENGSVNNSEITKAADIHGVNAIHLRDGVHCVNSIMIGTIEVKIDEVKKFDELDPREPVAEQHGELVEELTEEHIQNLKETFEILRRYKMKLNPSKCAFGVSSGKFLGFMVNHHGIESNPAKIQALLDMEPPRKIKESYLGKPPLLSKPHEGDFLILYLAVSKGAVSSALVREEDGIQWPIYYTSKSLLDAETRYPEIEKLALALMVAARKLRPYF